VQAGQLGAELFQLAVEALGPFGAFDDGVLGLVEKLGGLL
jgi:hypothetical protein